MADLNKSQYMGLPQWTNQDNWEVEDFTEALKQIDEEIAQHGVSIRWKGADKSGTEDSSAAILEALASGDTAHVAGGGVYLITQNVTVPVNKVLNFGRNARLKPVAGATITIEGMIEAQPHDWIFDLSSGGTVVGNPKITRVYPQWFGAIENDPSVDDTDAFDQASEFVEQMGGGTLAVPRGGYMLKRYTWRTRVHTVGEGKFITVFNALDSDDDYFLTIPPGPVVRGSIRGISFYGNKAANPTQGCMLFEARGDASNTTGGLWWSDLVDLSIHDFAGVNIWFKGGPTTASFPNQFINLNNVESWRDNSAGNEVSRALKLTGQCGQFCILGGEYDGAVYDQKYGTNIELSKEYDSNGVALGGNAPYSIVFQNVTIQSAELLGIIDNAVAVSFDATCYFEKAKRGFDIKNTAWAINFSINQFADVGADSGYGYLFDIRLSNVNIVGNYLGTPDIFVTATSDHQGIFIDRNYSAADILTIGVVARLFPASSIIDIKRKKIVWLDAAYVGSSWNGDITQINHKLNVGETLTVIVNGAFRFVNTGNLDLGAFSSLSVQDKDVLVFTVSDHNASDRRKLVLISPSRRESDYIIKTVNTNVSSVDVQYTQGINFQQPNLNTITAINRGTAGQTIDLQAYNNNTTIQSNAGIALNNGLDVTIPNQGILTLRYNAGKWNEYNRSWRNDQTQTLGATDTTIDARNKGIINLSHSSATTITAITNGIQGQELKLQAYNGNTTIQNNAGIVLTGRVNAAIPNQGFLKLYFNSGIWYEEYRRFG